MAYTQDSFGNRSFPPRPSPEQKPSLNTVPQKVKAFGNFGEQFKGYGEQGDGVEVNTEAPYGNKKLVDAGKFVQNQFTKGTTLDPSTPAETSIRNVRVADPGPEFGRGPIDGSLEIAGEKRAVGKWFPVGGKSYRS